MRTRIVSLAAVGCMLCSSPAFAEDHANAPQSYVMEGLLIGSGVGILTGATAGVLLCPEESSDFVFHKSPAICGTALGSMALVPGMVLGTVIGSFIPKDSGPTALLVSSTNGRDAASLNLLVRF